MKKAIKNTLKQIKEASRSDIDVSKIISESDAEDKETRDMIDTLKKLTLNGDDFFCTLKTS